MYTKKGVFHQFHNSYLFLAYVKISQNNLKQFIYFNEFDSIDLL